MRIMFLLFFVSIIAVSSCTVGPTILNSSDYDSNSTNSNSKLSASTDLVLTNRRIAETEELCTLELEYFLSGNNNISDFNSEKISVDHYTFKKTTDTYRDKIYFYISGDNYRHSLDCTVQFLQPEAVTLDLTNVDDIDRHLSGDYYFKLLEFTVDGETMLQDLDAETKNETAITNNSTEMPQPTPIPIPYIGPITMAKGVTPSGYPFGRTPNFPEGTSKVYAVFDYQGMNSDLDITVIWYQNGKEMASITNKWWGKESGKEATYRYWKNEEEIPEGDYNLEFFIDGKLMQSADFTIGETTSEQIGKARISEKDGMEMVMIREKNGLGVSEVWVDKIPVTNEMFAKFLNERGNKIQQGTGVYWFDAPGNPYIWRINDGTWKPISYFSMKRPAVGVTWYGAWNYCQWAGREISPFGPEYYDENLVTLGKHLSEWGVTEDVKTDESNLQPIFEGDYLPQPVLGLSQSPNSFVTNPSHSFNYVGFRCYERKKQ